MVTRSTLEGLVFVEDTLRIAYVDLVPDQNLPRGVQNDDRPSRDLQIINQSVSKSGGPGCN